MTKRWSSTKSMDGQTKRQASKRYRREFVEELLKAAKEPPEATFDNAEDALAWLDDRRDCPWKCKQGDPKCLCVRSRGVGQNI